MCIRLNPLPRLKSFAHNHKILTALLLLVGVPIATLNAYWMSASTRGKIAAHLDLRRGHYTLLAYGLPPAGEPEYRRVLKDRYGIEWKRIANCTVSTGLVDYANSYNEIMLAAINHKFGVNVFFDARREASKVTDPCASNNAGRDFEGCRHVILATSPQSP